MRWTYKRGIKQPDGSLVIDEQTTEGVYTLKEFLTVINDWNRQSAATCRGQFIYWLENFSPTLLPKN